MGMEALRLDECLTNQTESAFVLVFGGVFQRGLVNSCRRGKDEELAISEHAINVKEQKFDLLRTRLSGKSIGHGRDSSIYNLGWVFAMRTAKREFHNTTVRLPRHVYERAKASLEQTAISSSFNEFVVQAIEEKVQRLSEAELDAAFAEMARDPDYQNSSVAMSREFERSDWEALQPASPSREPRQPKTRASQGRTR